MPQFAKQFYVIEEHYVIFYAKFVIDDQVGSRIINGLVQANAGHL